MKSRSNRPVIIALSVIAALMGCRSFNSGHSAQDLPSQDRGDAGYYEDGYAEANYYRGTTYGVPGYVGGENYSASRIPMATHKSDKRAPLSPIGQPGQEQ